MKKLIALFASLIVVIMTANSQNIIKHAPAGFDSLRTGIPHGKIDSITYPSKTVGSNRKAVIYLPPNYSKTKNILCYIFCMALAAMKRNGLKEASHRLFWIIFMLKTKLSQ